MKKESCYPPASEMNSVALNGVDTRETTEKNHNLMAMNRLMRALPL